MKRGFSLLEAVFSLGLVALAFWLIGGILGEYSRIDRFARDHDRATEVLGPIFSRLRADCQSSIEILTPGRGASDTELRLRKFSPRPDRLAPVRTWDPHLAEDIVAVRYFLTNENLYRSSSGLQESLVDSVDAFQCTRVDPSGLEVQLTLAGDQPRSLSTHIHLRVWSAP
jgi:type II secretory pathway component PulJ